MTQLGGGAVRSRIRSCEITRRNLVSRFASRAPNLATRLSSYFWRPDTPPNGGAQTRTNDDAKGTTDESKHAAEDATGGGILRSHFPFLFLGKRCPGCRVPVSGGAGGAIALVAVARHTRRKKIVTVITATLGTGA